MKAQSRKRSKPGVQARGHEAEQNVCPEGGAGEMLRIPGVVYVGAGGGGQASCMEDTASPQTRRGDEVDMLLE